MLPVEFVFQYLRTSPAVGFERIHVGTHHAAITVRINEGNFKRFGKKQGKVEPVLNAFLQVMKKRKGKERYVKKQHLPAELQEFVERAIEAARVQTLFMVAD